MEMIFEEALRRTVAGYTESIAAKNVRDNLATRPISRNVSVDSIWAGRIESKRQLRICAAVTTFQEKNINNL